MQCECIPEYTQCYAAIRLTKMWPGISLSTLILIEPALCDPPKAPPSNEPDDDNDDNGEWANTDIDACDPFTEEVHHTESPYRPAACSPHHQCCWGTDEPRARRRSFRRPQTAAAYTGYSAPSLRGGIADCTHQRPKSAGGVGMGRRGMPHWPGARLTTRPGLAARLPSRRPSLCQVNGIGACKRGARRGVRAGGAGGSSQKVSRGCCRPQVEATWSYRPSKRPGKRDSPRQILVKVPCVKSNGKGRRGRVSYTLAWNSDAREDGCDGEIHDTSDNGDKKALEVVNDESEGVVADSVYGGTSFRQNTTAVGQVSRPLPLKASSTATGAGSIPPQANVEGTPRRTSVTTQLRSSVEHQRRPTSSSKAGDAAKMTANLPNFSCESQGKPCDRPPNVSTADNRGGRTSTIRSHSATTDTRTSSRDPRSHREGVGTQGGGVGTYVLTGDIISAPKRESSWAGPTEASVNAYALRPKTADKTRKVRREGAVSVEYSFFPSPKVEGHGEGCIFTKRNHSIPPFGAGEVNGSVSEWERSMCSTTDDARSGFGFDVGSPGTLRGTLRETVDC